MKKNLVLIILISAIILSGCKSLFTREGNLLSDAKQAEKRGDYHAAVLNAAESVRIDNEYKKAIEFLKELYPRANSHYTLKIDQTRSLGGNDVNDKVALYYKYLMEINETVRSLPPITDPATKLQLSLSYTDYQAELDKANEAAAEVHYKKGVELLKLKGRENAKSASEEFEEAVDYIPGYKDAESLIKKAREQAIQILAFFPFVNNAWNIPTAQFADIMEGAIISSLMSDQNVMKYTKIIDQGMQDRIIEEQVGSLNVMMNDESRVEIGELLNSNIFISGTIDAAFLEGPSTSMSQYHRTADIEVTPEEESESSDSEGYYKDNTSSLEYDSENTDAYYKDNTSSEESSTSTDITVYGTREVSADVFHYTKNISFEVTISYKAIDVESGAILKNNTISIFSEDSSEWAEWSGNEDALTDEDKLLIDSYEESVKSARQIASDAAGEAGNQIALELASFLK